VKERKFLLLFDFRGYCKKNPGSRRAYREYPIHMEYVLSTEDT
jgi:hypothetical protein